MKVAWELGILGTPFMEEKRGQSINNSSVYGTISYITVNSHCVIVIFGIGKRRQWSQIRFFFKLIHKYYANERTYGSSCRCGGQRAVITLDDDVLTLVYIVALDSIFGSPFLVVDTFLNTNQEPQCKIRVITHPPVLSRYAGHRRDEPYALIRYSWKLYQHTIGCWTRRTFSPRSCIRPVRLLT